MRVLTSWLRHYLPTLTVSDRQLADDLTLRGIAVEGVHPLASGHLFEMDITTNRVDAMNHYGIAREAATIYNLPLAPLHPQLPVGTLVDEPFSVRIAPEAKGLCGRFTAQVLRGVTIGPSTGRVAEFFGLLGQKQISNAVDASNFTLLGMGHPTHAFDLDKIEGGIVVRLARKGEKLRLLDGTERTLEADDLVVADEKKALALAGVMGGWDSMITPETKNILVEAAWFDQASVRRSSRRHLLHTDASHRFERGADFNAAPLANALVSELILESGGKPEGEMIDVIDAEVEAKTAKRPSIELAVAEVRRHLGTTIDAEGITGETVLQYLTSLGCAPLLHGLEIYQVMLPSWRLDLEREIDLIEEIARVYGYNRFANTLPTPLPVVEYPTAAAEHAVRTRLLELGYSEAVSSTFASSDDAAVFYAAEAGRQTVAMENPLSEEASLLRPALAPGMLGMLANNINRDVREVRLFEQGQSFTGTLAVDGDFVTEVHESAQLSLGLTSGSLAATALHAAADAPIFELKGVVESLASLFTLQGGEAGLSFTTANGPAWLEQGRGAVALLNGQPLAVFGELATAQRESRKLRQPVYLAQLDLAKLYELPLKRVTAHDLSRFQAAERDFSFVFADSVAWKAIAEAIHALSIPELTRLAPVEIFRDPKGKAIPNGQYSLLLRTVFQSPERTLREEEIAGWTTSIVDALKELGGTQRA
ncbi:MAG: phenylalanine--tRNA ligase subunit beta [Edaphobacter sp.]|uniref:phenylalanine--tRNA ligase subunit beta n=1 Tax=Edaphobacter sp. TaxID=1934404 RepID=UPI00238F61C9|nr:phenylalanine--tRNA ligase subunit beta [Edaphobacter sp.]MDE1176531.1 phenylalanine--tRNA ligase subunit beta [Edaphobacter sp.]